MSVIIAKRAADSARRERFRREARAPSRLSHPNVCAVCDIGTQNDVDYIVMEQVRTGLREHDVAGLQVAMPESYPLRLVNTAAISSAVLSVRE